MFHSDVQSDLLQVKNFLGITTPPQYLIYFILDCPHNQLTLQLLFFDLLQMQLHHPCHIIEFFTLSDEFAHMSLTAEPLSRLFFMVG